MFVFTHIFLLPLVSFLSFSQQSVGLLQFGLSQFALQVTVLVDLLQTLQEEEESLTDRIFIYLIY